MSAHRYEGFRAGGVDFPGLLPLLDEAERGRRDGEVAVYGARRIGDRLGWETIGVMTRTGGVVEIEGLEPADGPGEGGGS